ncbi:ECF-type sigma factor [Solimonas terrae]|uniref:Sigma-70 family RNA polymerase sigma factor n=1 Tax=Solimonas terrae TaxID=1396819 RepID=A0A6M2BS22_9GAMM|nr:ECF-type sigma factor [Solimonas terrae]NGY05011.1 sigma-70 family RNA polymerase sigma factor [Solimonas terrae]
MGEITTLLQRAQGGDTQAHQALFTCVYNELRVLARARLAQESALTQLDATGLVHETYLRLSNGVALPATDRRAFFALAAAVMRNVLVDHARRRQSAKRGGGVAPVTLITQVAAECEADEPTDVEALDAALKQLQRFDPRCHDVVELRYFGGLSLEEIAESLNMSLATVKRDWQKARAFLFRSMRS